MLKVAVPLPVYPDEQDGNQSAEGVGDHHGQPDAVQLEEKGQEDDHATPEEEQAQEGDQGGDGPVAQGGEEAGAVDPHAAEEVAQGENAEAVDGHLQQLRVVAHKGHRQRPAQHLGQHHLRGGSGGCGRRHGGHLCGRFRLLP